MNHALVPTFLQHVVVACVVLQFMLLQLTVNLLFLCDKNCLIVWQRQSDGWAPLL